MSTYFDHLRAIRDEHGELTRRLVVDTAAAEDHPLHDYFDWDDRVAGDKWRLEQAGQLLRAVKLPADPSRPRDLRAFVAVKGRETHRADYVPTEEALADDFTRQLVLRDMEREWRLLKRRYQYMREFADLILRDLRGEAS